MRLALACVALVGCATMTGGHYVTTPPDAVACAQAALRAAAAQAKCDVRPPPPAADIVACAAAALAELVPCAPGREWVPDPAAAADLKAVP